MSTKRSLGRPTVVTTDVLQKAQDLYEQDYSLAKISNALGVSTAALHRAFKKNGISTRTDSYNKHKLNDNFFSAIDSEEKAYWLGFISADGNVYGTRIQVNLKDREHLQKLQISLSTDAPIVTYQTKGYTLHKILFRSKKMVLDLAILGVGARKSLTIKPIVGLGDLQRHYWRGMIDGDGWVSKTKTGFVLGLCGNRYMVEGFIDFIQSETGITGRLYQTGNIFAVQYTSKEKLSAICTLLYGGSSISLERKLAVVNQL